MPRGVGLRLGVVARLEGEGVHELVAALLNDAQILHHVRFSHASAAQRFAERALVAADLAEYTLDALLQMRHCAR